MNGCIEIKWGNMVAYRVRCEEAGRDVPHLIGMGSKGLIKVIIFVRLT